MNFGPDFSSDEDGFSDDNDYYDFKERLKRLKEEKLNNIRNENLDPIIQQKESIYRSICGGQFDVIVQELNNGFDVKSNLKYGWTALLLAASLGNSTIVSELVARGANINDDLEGMTVLMYACDGKPTEDRLEAIKFLVEHGADINAIDHHRRMAIMFAALHGNIDALEYLLPLCKDKYAADNQKWTALFWAIEGNKIETVKYLLVQNFNYTVSDLRGDTPKIIAEERGYNDIANLFVENKCEKYFLETNYDEIISEEIGKNKILFPFEIVRILHAVHSDILIPKLKNKNIDLLNFLSSSDEDLINLNIKLPYQRRRILTGLYRFHKHDFDFESIVLLNNDTISTMDLCKDVISAIKQIISMEATLKFINKHSIESTLDKKEIVKYTQKISDKVETLVYITEHLNNHTENWNQLSFEADLIKKKRKNIPWANIIVTALCITSLIAYKIIK